LVTGLSPHQTVAGQLARAAAEMSASSRWTYSFAARACRADVCRRAARNDALDPDVFYDNPSLSMLSVMLFPDDLDLARKCVAHFLSSGTLQDTLGAGVQIDKPYMAAIISDLATVGTHSRRRMNPLACGFSLTIGLRWSCSIRPIACRRHCSGSAPA
jgi:hypothetical protein